MPGVAADAVVQHAGLRSELHGQLGQLEHLLGGLRRRVAVSVVLCDTSGKRRRRCLPGVAADAVVQHAGLQFIDRTDGEW